jgi:hypothetical protein
VKEGGNLGMEVLPEWERVEEAEFLRTVRVLRW